MMRLGFWRSGLRRARRDGGSMTVELAVIAPGLIALLLLVGAGGRVVEVQGHIDGAARDAARAASVAQSAQQASEFAQQAALADLGPSSWCSNGTVQAQVSGFPAGAIQGPQNVTVTVRCSVDMSPFRLLGFGQTMTFTGSAIAPLDVFTCRDAVGC